jgi:hypothetical protein
MEALSVVEHLDEFKHRCVRLLARVEPWSCTSSFLSVLKKLSTTALS